MEEWDKPGVADADFVFFNNSSDWFNNGKALVRAARKEGGREGGREGD